MQESLLGSFKKYVRPKFPLFADGKIKFSRILVLAKIRRSWFR